MKQKNWIFVLSLKVGKASGWCRCSIAILAGILSACALPPLHLIPMLFISFPCLIWLVDGASSCRRAFLDGWWFGLGHFLAGLYWITFSLTIDQNFFWLIPFSLLGIPAVIAIYIACATAFLRFARKGLVRIALFAASWVFFEWLRGILFTGFPWNGIGLVWANSESAIQIVSYIGLIGLGFLTVFWASSLAALAYEKSFFSFAKFIPFVICLSIVLIPGYVRLAITEKSGFHKDIYLRIVQPNIPQSIKWSKSHRMKHLSSLLELSRRPSSAPIIITVWPETASPFVVSLSKAYRKVLGDVMSENGFLLTGSIRLRTDGIQNLKIWNSLHAISSKGRVIMTYDKHHLVPFGEFVPFSGILRKHLGIKKITTGRTDFSAGNGPKSFILPKIPSFSPSICYEVIFSNKVAYLRDRPKWFLNITNDAWFGNSSGPYQHLAMARMRAVEQGIPLVRAANTGISAIVDPFGHIMKFIPLEKKGVIDFYLPKPIEGGTVYSRIGDWPILVFIFIMGVYLVLRFR